MKVNVKVEKVTPIVNIIKDEKAELEQFELIINGIIENIKNDPEQGEKAKKIGEEKLREMALQIYKEIIKENEQKQIENALKIADNVNEALIKGVVEGAKQIGKNL